MSINMVRGYSQPPASGGAAYHGFGRLQSDDSSGALPMNPMQQYSRFKHGFRCTCEDCCPECKSQMRGFGELSSQFGYTYVTQEGEGWSEPHAESFHPIEHWNEYGHPVIDATRGPGLLVPGPLGGCAGGCGCGGACGGGSPGPMGGFNDAGGSGATGPGYGPFPEAAPSKLPMLALAAVAALIFFKKPRGVFGRAPNKRKRRSRR